MLFDLESDHISRVRVVANRFDFFKEIKLGQIQIRTNWADFSDRVGFYHL
jgi:hypothetical protein